MEQKGIKQEKPKKPMEEMMEEEFLKELYIFMRKRETPIERIPNLGFKQIDLFLMFKVVGELGGYYQVTAQQQWKQVYNTLGGNPRSTSAATCTRRHYEKLLLPYECHLTGKQVDVVPRTPPKHLHFASYNKEQDDGQGPPKRRLLSVPLLQNPQILHPDLREPVFPLATYYAHPFHPSHAVLPPHVPISSSVLTPRTPSPAATWFPFPPSHPNPTDRSAEPLEQLRYLAEQYRTTTGLTEPLNLSVKAARREDGGVPASSFAPPSSNKSPKFLNKPSPLYAPHSQRAAGDDGRETQDGGAGPADTAYVIDLEAEAEAASGSGSPSLGAAGTDAGGPGDGRPEVATLPFGQALPRISRENGSKMEIEVPLSVFHNWLRQCGPSAALAAKPALLPQPRLQPLPQPLPLPQQRPQQPLPPRGGGFGPGRRSDAEFFPCDPTFRGAPRPRSSAREDPRSSRENAASPAQPAEAAVQNHFAAYRHLLLGSILKSPFDLHKLSAPKPPGPLDAYDKAARASGTSGNTDAAAASGAGSHAGHSPGVGSAPVLQLTNEEVMKLRRIISSSS